MLHGPPGTGKSSFVQAVSSKLEMNICIMNLASGTVDDDGLNNALTSAPNQSIILLEDIDAVFVGRDNFAVADQDEDDDSDNERE